MSELQHAPQPLSYRTLAAPVHAEFIEKKSRFLCSLIPVTSESDVHTHVAEIRKQFWDASHHCTAFRLKDGIERSNDDGEPSGSAGIPMLHALQQHQVQDVLAVVTRYFGGTLLGIGGLVRAYSRAVIHSLERAQLLEIAPHDLYRFSITYGQYDLAIHRCNQAGFDVEATFAEHITLTVIVPSTARDEARALIASITHDDQARVPIATEMRPSAVQNSRF